LRHWPRWLRVSHTHIDSREKEALTVPGVGVLACTLSASGRSIPALATALSPKGLTSRGRRGGAGRAAARASGSGGRASRGGGRASRGGGRASRRRRASGRGGGRARGGNSSGVGGAEVTNLDVGIGDGGVGLLRFDVGGLARGGCAGSTSGTGVGRVSWVGGVEPQHVDFMVIPDGHDQDHTLGQSLIHRGEASLVGEVVVVTESGLLGSAEVNGDRVVGSHAGNVGLGVGDNLAILDVETADLTKSTAGSTVGSDELSDDGDLLGGVDGQAGTEEGGITHAVGVEIASILVADTTIALIAITALGAGATVLTLDTAAVGCIGGSVLVGFPDIHLVTARAILALAGVGVVGGSRPSVDVGLYT
jgi:hypothetical protein